MIDTIVTFSEAKIDNLCDMHEELKAYPSPIIHRTLKTKDADETLKILKTFRNELTVKLTSHTVQIPLLNQLLKNETF